MGDKEWIRAVDEERKKMLGGVKRYNLCALWLMISNYF